MKTYRFECYDDEDRSTVTVEFTTDNDAWSGYEGPMYNFFNFLKGCGYVFGIEDEIGVLKVRDGEAHFVGANDHD